MQSIFASSTENSTVLKAVPKKNIMEIDIIGLGESVHSYVNNGNITIGVNDAYKHYPCDYIVVVDKIERFEKLRLETIKKSTPKKFFSQLDEWKGVVSNFQLMTFEKGRGSLNKLQDKNIIQYSNNSTYVACVMAYKMGATVINLYGVDFNTHQSFKNNSLNTALEHFKNLYKELLKLGVQIRVTENSRLSEFIRIIK